MVRADGAVVVFRVETVEHFPKDQLPAERIYGDYGPPGLRLITCGGQFIGGSTGYGDNVVAFATLSPPASPDRPTRRPRPAGLVTPGSRRPGP